mgnify:CR=1 FL=1
MLAKRAEYAHKEDVFKSFKNGTGFSLHTEPEQVAWSYLAKHLESQSSANTYYPFSITTGFATKAPGLMRALKLVNRNADIRVYKGQVTYEYIISE